MNNERFVYVTYIATTPQKVWDALLKSELTRQYWKHENISDWKPGSKWEHVSADESRKIEIVGEVLECIPNQQLALTWGAPETNKANRSRVVIDIETVDEMVRLTVTHDDLNVDVLRKITRGWPRVLSSLKSLLETGAPLNTWA